MFLLRGEAALQNVVDGFKESCEGRGSEIPSRQFIRPELQCRI
jgi:hypothetical protein